MGIIERIAWINATLYQATSAIEDGEIVWDNGTAYKVFLLESKQNGFDEYGKVQFSKVFWLHRKHRNRRCRHVWQLVAKLTILPALSLTAICVESCLVTGWQHRRTGAHNGRKRIAVPF